MVSIDSPSKLYELDSIKRGYSKDRSVARNDTFQNTDNGL